MTVRVIAEVGSVHDGSFGNAGNLIDVAASCGADIVKFQTHLPEAETLRDAPAPTYFTGEPRFEYFARTGFTPAQWRALCDRARERGIAFLSSPFSDAAVDLLEQIGVSGYKVASGEVTNLPLLERIADTGKEVILSSGMSTWQELDEAVEVLRKGGPLTILQCASSYPCPPERVGLNVIGEMRERYGVTVGYSDHTQGIAAAIAAVALGATVIEKHLTFSRLMYGSDAPLSMEPPAFAELVSSIRDLERILANPVDKGDASVFEDMKRIFQKSVVTARPVAAGTAITRDDLAFKKPGSGIAPRDWSRVVGRSARRDLPADHLLSEDDLS